MSDLEAVNWDGDPVHAKMIFEDTWKSMIFNGNEAAASLGAQINGNLWTFTEIHRIHNSWARKFDILWHPVAAHWMPLIEKRTINCDASTHVEKVACGLSQLLAPQPTTGRHRLANFLAQESMDFH